MVAVVTSTPHSSSTNTLVSLNTAEKADSVESQPCVAATEEFSNEPIANSSSWYLSDDSEDNDNNNSRHETLMSESMWGLNLTRLMQSVNNNQNHNTTTNNNNHHHNPMFQLTTLLSVPWALDVGLSRVVPRIVLEHTEQFLNTPRHVYNATCSSSSTGASSSTSTPVNNERLVYVGQAEVAHATCDQCDVLVSDRATTCHILALYSQRHNPDTTVTATPMSLGGQQHPETTRRQQGPLLQSSPTVSTLPLATLTHLDGTSYESCVRAMIHQHKCHHHHYDTSNNNNNNASNNNNNKIRMDIHIVGGYEDSRGSSRAISNWLILLLLQLAAEEKNTIEMNLQTCAMTCLNNETHPASPLPSSTTTTTTSTSTTTTSKSEAATNRNHNRCSSSDDDDDEIDTDDDDDDDSSDDMMMMILPESTCTPRGRGMAINVRTGQVKLAHVADEDLVGPLPALRAARLWANSNQPPSFVPKLSVVHTTTARTTSTTLPLDGDEFIIEPFEFGPWDELDWLLTLPDDALLQQTSTSPEVEEEDYCDQVRKSLELIRDWDWPTLFGPECNRPLIFRRRRRRRRDAADSSLNDWVWIPPTMVSLRPQESAVGRRIS